MPNKRQQELAGMIAQAVLTPELQEAMAVFKMGDEEYAKAIAAMSTVTITSGDSTNPRGERNANLGSDKD
jgi:hypothetical protein